MIETDLGGHQPRTTGEPTVSLLEVGTVLLRYRWLVAMWVIALPLAVGAYTLLQPRQWTARASFTPQASGDLVQGQLAAVAGQFGIDVGSSGGSATPEFYAELIQSTTVLMFVARDTFELAAEGAASIPIEESQATLAQLLDIEEPEADVAEAEVLEWLQEEAIRVRTDAESGIVEIITTTPWRHISAQVNQDVLEAIAAFNLRKRQTQARAEREFIEGQMGDAEAELLRAETALEEFLEANRSYRQSPELLFQYERLQRRVAMRQQVYTSLVQSYDQARIGEVRNTPVITVIDDPRIPAQPDSRGLLTKLAGSLLAGLLFGVLSAFGRENLRRRKATAGDKFEELATLWEDAKGELRRFLVVPRGDRS